LLGHVIGKPNDRIIKQVFLAAPFLNMSGRHGGKLKNWLVTDKSDLDTIGDFKSLAESRRAAGSSLLKSLHSIVTN